MNENILKIAQDTCTFANYRGQACFVGRFVMVTTPRLLDKLSTYCTDGLKNIDFKSANYWLFADVFRPTSAIPINSAEELAEFILNGDWEALK